MNYNMRLSIDASIRQGDFDFEINTKINVDTAGIFGPSGTGKSTLLHLISGLKVPDRGRITLGDKIFFDSELRINLQPSERNIGLVFQDGRLFPHMSVKKNLTFGSCRGNGKGIDFDHVIKTLDLDHLLKRRPANLSGGERQRVAIGRALLSAPEMLLLDEPFSAIDTDMRRELLPFINRIHNEFNLPLLLISHDLPEILQLTDYLLLIDKGRLYNQGRCSELLFDDRCSSRLINSRASTCFTGVITAKYKQNGTATISADTTKSLPSSEVDIIAPYSESIEIGERVRGLLTPQDVILSAAPAEFMSAQNQHRGRITRVKHLSDSTIVEVNVNGLALFTEVTNKASSDFPYNVGRPIWVIFKACAITYTPYKGLPNISSASTRILHTHPKRTPSSRILQQKVYSKTQRK